MMTTHTATNSQRTKDVAPQNLAAMTGAIEAMEDLLGMADQVVTMSTTNGSPLKFLGLAPLDREPRGYPGALSDWILLPASRDPLLTATGRLPMPAPARRQLCDCMKLIDFPVMLVAHEVTKGAVSDALGQFTTQTLCEAPAVRGDHLLSYLPTTATATGAAARMAEVADRVTTLGGTLIATAGIATGSLALATAAGATHRGIALASDLGHQLGGAIGGLDPILIGALPWQGRTTLGTPAALFEITRWNW